MHNHNGSKKSDMGFFFGTRHCATPLGELTRPTAVGGRPSRWGQVDWARTQECQPTHLTRRAPPGDPPGGDRLTRWQMSLCSLCSSSQRSPQGSTQADDGREPAPLCIRSGQPAKRGEGGSPASWEGCKLLPKHIKWTAVWLKCHSNWTDLQDRYWRRSERDSRRYDSM